MIEYSIHGSGKPAEHIFEKNKKSLEEYVTEQNGDGKMFASIHQAKRKPAEPAIACTLSFSKAGDRGLTHLQSAG